MGAVRPAPTNQGSHMKRAALPLLMLLAACDGFPSDRAEACLLETAREATATLTSAGNFLQGLTRDPAAKAFDIGSITLAEVAFGTCTKTGPDAFECTVEYRMDFSGRGGQALVDLAAALGQTIEAPRLETWSFRFGPTITDCAPV